MNNKIILPGGAGLVGQYLVARLKGKGNTDIVALDKHRANMAALRQVKPEITVEYTDLAESGWQRHFVGADVVVMLQAQISGNNNVPRFWSLIMMIIRNVPQFIFKKTNL